MVFGAKCKSFKIFVVALGLTGAALVADSQAERNPVPPLSIVKQSHFQTVVSDKTIAQFEAFKRDRIRNEKRWSKLKQFVGQQVAAASDKLASSSLSDWWIQPVTPVEEPVAGQQTGENSIGISPTTTMVKLIGNMSAVQWWQVSNQTTGLFDSIQGHVVHASTKLRAGVQASCLQLAKTSSNRLEERFSSFAVSSFVQGIFPGMTQQSVFKPLDLPASVSEATSADPYWSYYSACDFWGAEFNPADKE